MVVTMTNDSIVYDNLYENVVIVHDSFHNIVIVVSIKIRTVHVFEIYKIIVKTV